MELYKVINLVVVFQIIVFIVILKRRKELRRENKFFLILFLASVLYCLLDRTQFFYRDILNKHNFPHFYNSGEPFWYLHLPLFYLYVKSITTSGFKIRWIQLVHAVPFFIVLVYVLINFSFLPADMKYEALTGSGFEYRPPHKVAFFINMLLLQNFYLPVCYFLVYHYQKQKRNYTSNIKPYSITSLYIAISMFTIMLLIRLVLPLFIHLKDAMPIDLDLSVYAITILFLGFRQSQLFLNPQPNPYVDTRYKHDTELKHKLLITMKTDKPYLDPDLTLDLLAERLKCSPRRLSQLINKELDINFFTFINTYRIREAKQLFADKNCNDKTILEILYEVGFNNKSAFNRVFKGFTKQTPTQYRKSVAVK